LNYYTGTILEVKADNKPGYTISLCGGGRYDDLTGIFGLQGMSGVGISFGADRIYDLMCDHDLFPEIQGQSTQVLFVNFGKEESIYCLSVVQQLRMMGIKAELFPEPSKMKKQMSYADQKKIPFVVLAGSEEIRTGILSLKNMITGEQTQVEATELHKKLI
jgi:histidyl-tRNA synthetase